VPIGTIEALDLGKRTVSVRVIGRGGDQILRDVRLKRHQRIPSILEQAVVRSDGPEYYYEGEPYGLTQQEIEDNVQSGAGPGDNFQGDPEEGPASGVYAGGMAKCIANPLTGFIASAPNNTAQIMGDRLYRDTPSYHEKIETDPLDGNVQLETLLFGAPLALGGVAQVDMEKKSLDTRLGLYNLELQGWQSVNLKVKRSTIPPQPAGTMVTVEVETLVGPVSWSINGITGELVIEGAPKITIKSSPGGKVAINSDAMNPLDGIVTGRTRCPYTGGYHVQCSSEVFAGHGLV
jgi:hypothetical protein